MFSRARFIDLTHPLDAEVPTWTGSCGFHHEIKMDYEEGLRVMTYKMHAGVGTHMDAPSHFFREGKNIGDLPLEQLITPLFHINYAHNQDPNFLLTAEQILAFEKKYGKILSGSSVVLSTGWAKKWKDVHAYRNPDVQEKMHFPGFHKDAAALLLERNISGMGIDTLSPDGSNVGFPVHEQILGAGKYILENLTNMEQVPETGAFLIALPMKVRAGAEACVRAISVDFS